MCEARETWSPRLAARWIQDAPRADDHKYTRGVLGVRTGSQSYPGAAILGVEAAWRTGLGMVRYLPFEGEELGGAAADPLRNAVLNRRPETVFVPGRTDAWLVGSGVDAEKDVSAVTAAMRDLVSGRAPLVVDAGAIAVVASEHDVRAPVIITPHAGEFSKLVRDLGMNLTSIRAPEDALLSEAARRLNVTIMLKGSVTRVATPGGRLGATSPATPWLATAGTGDVLAGVLGALAARHHEVIAEDPELLLDVGLSAALLHDAAARIASRNGTAPLTALDVAQAIPAALERLHAS